MNTNSITETYPNGSASHLLKERFEKYGKLYKYPFEIRLKRLQRHYSDKTNVKKQQKQNLKKNNISEV